MKVTTLSMITDEEFITRYKEVGTVAYSRELKVHRATIYERAKNLGIVKKQNRDKPLPKPKANMWDVFDEESKRNAVIDARIQQAKGRHCA